MDKIYISPVAESIPFDNDTNGFTSDNVQDAIEEASQGGGGGGCCFVDETSSENQSSTTSTNWKIKIDWDKTLGAGRYKLGFYFEWQYLEDGKTCQFQVRVNNSLKVANIKQEGMDDDGSYNPWHTHAGFRYFDLTAGTHEFEIRYRTNESGKRVRIRAARLDLWKVD